MSREDGYLAHYASVADRLDTRRFALKAAEEATAAPKERNVLETSVLVGQVRSTAMDLLRASGMGPSDSLRALREVARHASKEMPAAL